MKASPDGIHADKGWALPLAGAQVSQGVTGQSCTPGAARALLTDPAGAQHFPTSGHSHVTKPPCLAQQLRRSHAGSPQIPGPDCAAASSKGCRLGHSVKKGGKKLNSVTCTF